MNAIDLALSESYNKEEFIESMNKLGYEVNWTDTRKYITYTTPEGYKCRDNKLYNEKYSKGAMENEFRRIKEEQSNNKGKSNSTFSSKDELLHSRYNCSRKFISVESEDERRYSSNKKECARYTSYTVKDQYKHERENGEISRRKNSRSISRYENAIKRDGDRLEKEYFQSKKKNGYNSIFNGIASISNIFSGSEINNKPKRKI